MDLSSCELAAFRTFLDSPGIRHKEFMKKTGLSRPRAYSVIKQLKGAGLIVSDGRPAVYSLSGNEKTARLSRLFKLFGQYPVEKVLSRNNNKVLRAILGESKTAEELSKEAGLSRPQTYKILSQFARMGLVKNDRDRFFVAADHPLYKCLTDYGKPIPFNTELEKDAAIIWHGRGEYLIQPDDAEKYTSRISKPWRYTSTSAVNRYGIDIIPPKTTLYVADRTNQAIKNSEGKYTNLEDTIIFTLLHATGDSKNYARYMILLKKDIIDQSSLRRKAKHYKIGEILESILYDLKPMLKNIKQQNPYYA
jgi:predicted transcriptional regulator